MKSIMLNSGHAPRGVLAARLPWRTNIWPNTTFKNLSGFSGWKAGLNINAIKKFRNRTPVIFMGMIEQIRKILTKRGEPMIFLKLLDLTDNIEAVVFPGTLNEYGHLLEEDKCVIIRGKVSTRNNEPSIICEEFKKITT